MLLCFASPSHPWQLGCDGGSGQAGLNQARRGCAVNPKEGEGISLFSDHLVFS